AEGKFGHTAGQGRERGPPEDDPHQDAARAVPVAPVPSRDLEEPVGDGEGPEHEAHGRVRDVQLGLDGPSSLADANAVDVADEGQGGEEGEHAVADARGRSSSRGVIEWQVDSHGWASYPAAAGWEQKKPRCPGGAAGFISGSAAPPMRVWT